MSASRVGVSLIVAVALFAPLAFAHAAGTAADAMCFSGDKYDYSCAWKNGQVETVNGKDVICMKAKPCQDSDVIGACVTEEFCGGEKCISNGVPGPCKLPDLTTKAVQEALQPPAPGTGSDAAKPAAPNTSGSIMQQLMFNPTPVSQQNFPTSADNVAQQIQGIEQSPPASSPNVLERAVTGVENFFSPNLSNPTGIQSPEGIPANSFTPTNATPQESVTQANTFSQSEPTAPQGGTAECGWACSAVDLGKQALAAVGTTLENALKYVGDSLISPAEAKNPIAAQIYGKGFEDAGGSGNQALAFAQGTRDSNPYGFALTNAQAEALGLSPGDRAEISMGDKSVIGVYDDNKPPNNVAPVDINSDIAGALGCGGGTCHISMTPVPRDTPLGPTTQIPEQTPLPASRPFEAGPNFTQSQEGPTGPIAFAQNPFVSSWTGNGNSEAVSPPASANPDITTSGDTGISSGVAPVPSGSANPFTGTEPPPGTTGAEQQVAEAQLQAQQALDAQQNILNTPNSTVGSALDQQEVDFAAYQDLSAQDAAAIEQATLNDRLALADQQTNAFTNAVENGVPKPDTTIPSGQEVTSQILLSSTKVVPSLDALTELPLAPELTAPSTLSKIGSAISSFFASQQLYDYSLTREMQGMVPFNPVEQTGEEVTQQVNDAVAQTPSLASSFEERWPAASPESSSGPASPSTFDERWASLTPSAPTAPAEATPAVSEPAGELPTAVPVEPQPTPTPSLGSTETTAPPAAPSSAPTVTTSNGALTEEPLTEPVQNPPLPQERPNITPLTPEVAKGGIDALVKQVYPDLSPTSQAQLADDLRNSMTLADAKALGATGIKNGDLVFPEADGKNMINLSALQSPDLQNKLVDSIPANYKTLYAEIGGAQNVGPFVDSLGQSQSVLAQVSPPDNGGTTLSALQPSVAGGTTVDTSAQKTPAPADAPTQQVLAQTFPEVQSPQYSGGGIGSDAARAPEPSGNTAPFSGGGIGSDAGQSPNQPGNIVQIDGSPVSEVGNQDQALSDFLLQQEQATAEQNAAKGASDASEHLVADSAVAPPDPKTQAVFEEGFPEQVAPAVSPSTCTSGSDTATCIPGGSAAPSAPATQKADAGTPTPSPSPAPEAVVKPVVQVNPDVTKFNNALNGLRNSVSAFVGNPTDKTLQNIGAQVQRTLQAAQAFSNDSFIQSKAADLSGLNKAMGYSPQLVYSGAFGYSGLGTSYPQVFTGINAVQTYLKKHY